MKKFVEKNLLFILFFFLLAAPAAAGVGEWTSQGPFGGPVHYVTADPGDGSIVFAVTRMGIFRSLDQGRNWARVLELQQIYDPHPLVIDPLTPSTVYASGNRILYRSEDGGSSWEEITDRNFDVLVADPRDGTLYASSPALRDVIYRSRDRGLTWRPFDVGLGDAPVRSLAILSATEPASLYAASAQGVARSRDDGESWSLVLTGDFTVLASSPTTSTVYAASPGVGVFVTHDGGVSWTLGLAGLDDLDIRALAVNPGTPTTVFAGTASGAFRSHDAGATWMRQSTGPAVLALALPAGEPDVILVGSDEGFSRSADGGASFEESSTGITATWINVLEHDPLFPEIIYAGGVGGLYVSMGAGHAWSPLSRGLGGGEIRGLAIDPTTAPATLFVGNQAGFHRSSDGGQTWHQPSAVLRGQRVGPIAVDPRNPSILYASTDTSFFKSTDGGESFVEVENLKPLLTGNSVSAIAIDPRDSLRLFVGHARNVVRSVDGGETWKRAQLERDGTSFLVIRDLEIDPRDGAVYAGGRLLLQRSLDGGESWSSWTEGWPGPSKPRVVGLEIVPGATSSTIYGKELGRIFERRNDATRWRSVAPRVPFPFGVGGSSFELRPGPVLTVGGPGGVFEYEAIPRTGTLELRDGRFEVRVDWRDASGQSGPGIVAAVPGEHGEEVDLRSDDTAMVSFFSRDNWEMLLKVLDGTAVNEHYWVLLGAATDAGYAVTVTDTHCGGMKTYRHAPGSAAPAVVDTEAFQQCFFVQPPVRTCFPDDETFCFGDEGRFEAHVTWDDGRGGSGIGRQVEISRPGLAASEDSGLFYFFSEDNWELLVKVLDGCAVNGHYWVFGAATTDVEYTLTVTDTLTGQTAEFFNPLGNAADAINDTSAFATCEEPRP